MYVKNENQSAANRVCEQLGINPDAWHDAQVEGGCFQGVAIGNRASREVFAKTQGK